MLHAGPMPKHQFKRIIFAVFLFQNPKYSGWEITIVYTLSRLFFIL
jgi:hypothetical protein